MEGFLSLCDAVIGFLDILTYLVCVLGAKLCCLAVLTHSRYVLVSQDVNMQARVPVSTLRSAPSHS